MNQIHPLVFFEHLRWIDGRPLLDTIEPYRRATFTESLYSFDPDGRPRYNRALIGRAKKNFKSSDLVLAALYRFIAWNAPQGNDSFLVANDEQQANDDLTLTKKLIEVNPLLANEVRVLSKEIQRLDGKGSLKILPANDAAGAHGKTYLFLGYDEIHAYKDYALIEALSPDPTRSDVMVWTTSYSSILHRSGSPLYDMLARAKTNQDPRLCFSWYSASYTTDPALQSEHISGEVRANPSMSSWDNPDYLEQQRAILPTGRFRRLHLNEPGSPEGAAFQADAILACVVKGRRRLPYQPHLRYLASVDMSHGSDDDAGFGIAHRDPDTNKAIVDLAIRQDERPPFNARRAVAKFATIARDYYGLGLVTGDAAGGMTYRLDFQEHGVGYRLLPKVAREAKGQPSASDYYEAFDAKINAGEVELPDDPVLIEQLLGLVWKNNKITHENGAHDDIANAVAIAAVLAAPIGPQLVVTSEHLAMAARHARGQPVNFQSDRPPDHHLMTSQQKLDLDFSAEVVFGPAPEAPFNKRTSLYLSPLMMQRVRGLATSAHGNSGEYTDPFPGPLSPITPFKK